MTTAMLDAIDSHIQRGHAVFGELSSAPFLPSSVKGATDFGNIAPPALCSATIASLASTVTALVRRVARLETTCVVLEGKWLGAIHGRGSSNDSLAFSEAISSAMRPLNDMLSRHEAAIERIAAHITVQETVTAPPNAYRASHVVDAGKPIIPTSAPTQMVDDTVQRLELVAHNLRSMPSVDLHRQPQAAETPTPPPPPQSEPTQQVHDATKPYNGSSPTSGGGYTTTSGSSHPVTTPTTSDGLRPLSLRGSSFSTNEALRALWGHAGSHPPPPQRYPDVGPTGIDASAMTISGGVSHEVSADEANIALTAALTSMNDISGPSGQFRPSTRHHRYDGLSSTGESGMVYGTHQRYGYASGGIFNRVRGILSGDEGSDTSYR